MRDPSTKRDRVKSHGVDEVQNSHPWERKCTTSAGGNKRDPPNQLVHTLVRPPRRASQIGGAQPGNLVPTSNPHRLASEAANEESRKAHVGGAGKWKTTPKDPGKGGNPIRGERRGGKEGRRGIGVADRGKGGEETAEREGRGAAGGRRRRKTFRATSWRA
ncbi:hypothetical protein Nepgr_032628 [Nepenthes gracilis]|uniref:Uncharacterized protein n=1 Tax=Nepenthes gracilis TaxID=150966 RepID=A0AAD3TIZ5_NEPGR|nr:hypothetical protein Nepgr_032628 [Nepenthes gracilis]